MNTKKSIVVGILAGLIASWVKSLTEPPLQKVGLHYFPATEVELKEIKGADIAGHPENMPPAVVSKEIYNQWYSEKLSDREAVKTIPYIHYALGTFLGLVYIQAVQKTNKATSLEGLSAGLIVFALTHGSIVPALKLQGKVSDMPKSWWVWELGSHLLFGLTLEQSRKILQKTI